MAQFEAREIGARIAQARRERSLTQEQLAEMAPFSKRSLQDYENGVTIPYRNLRDLARLLDRPEEWFLYGDRPESERESNAIAQVADLREELRRRHQEVLERLDGLAEQQRELALRVGERVSR